MLRRPHPIGPNQRLIGAATALAIVALKNWLKVRSGSIASVCPSADDFRSSPINGHRHGRSACLKSANIRHATCELTPVLPAVSWLSISATVERASRPRVVSGDCTATESLQDQVCNAPSNCVACLTSEVSNPSVNDAHRGPSNSRHSPLRPW